MIGIEYKNAYTEVLEILKYVSKEELNKIPKEMIKNFVENANSDYYFSYNPERTLDEQAVSKTAKYIIAILFRNYWATQNQKEKILRKEKYDLVKIEHSKKEKYNPDGIFNSKINSVVIFNSSVTDLVEYKQDNLWDRIKKFLSKIINRS